MISGMDSHARWVPVCLILIKIVLAFLALYVPLLYLPAAVLFPLPVALLVRKYHLGLSLFGLLSVFLIVSLFGNVWPVMAFIMKTGIIGLVMGILFKNHVSFGRSIITLIILSIIMTTSSFLLVYAVERTNPFTVGEIVITEYIQQDRLFGDDSILNAQEQQQMQQNIDQILGIMTVLMPGHTIIWGIILIFASYLLAIRLFRHLNYPVHEFPSFVYWQYPWYVIWGFIAGLAFYLAGDIWHSDTIRSVGLNLIYVMSFLYIVLGISIFMHFMYRWKTSVYIKGLFALILVIYWPIALSVMLTLGTLDAFIKLRRLGVQDK